MERVQVPLEGVDGPIQGFFYGPTIDVEALERRAVRVEPIAVWLNDNRYLQQHEIPPVSERCLALSPGLQSFRRLLARCAACASLGLTRQA